MAACSGGTCILSRFRRKGLFEARSQWLASRKIVASSFLGNCFKHGSILFRTLSTSVSFPWTQKSTDVYKKDPLMQRLLGGYFLGKALQRVPNGKFDSKEFLHAAKNCIEVTSEVLHDHDKENKLQELVGSELLGYLQQALKKMVHSDHHLDFCLEVKQVSSLSISGVRSLVGPLIRSDDQVFLDFGGQKVITSSTEFDSLIKDGMPVNLSECKRLAKASFEQGLRFQLDVKFATQEKFYISDDTTDEVLSGSKQLVSSYHMWQFESLFDWECYREGSYPLSWTLADMDQFCKNNSIPPKTVKAWS